MVIFLGGVIGEKGKIYMKNKIKYSDEPIDVEVMNDFLPSPELVPREGIEPSRPYDHELLRHACLPFHHLGLD